MPTDNTTDSNGHSPDELGFLRDLAGQELEVKLHLLQHYAKLAEMLAREMMEEEVAQLAEERYRRTKPRGGRYSRWGRNPGSIQIGDERVPVAVPHVRETEAGKEQPLETYHQMKRPVEADSLEKAILLALSQHNYGRVASAFIDGFGLTSLWSAAVSRSVRGRPSKPLRGAP